MKMSLKPWLLSQINPGRLPNDISVEDLLTNNYKSTPRNKKIAEFFKDLGLIEKYGSGIGRIIGYFKEENLPLPKFENISAGFQVTVFPADIEEVASGQTSGQTSGTKLSKIHQKIIDIIHENPKITRKELSNALNINSSAIQKHIDKLKKENIIYREGGDFGGFWKIKNK